MTTPFKKILIANRGEIAVRIIRACKEFGIKTVAIYSETDKASLHCSLADEKICIGPPNLALSYLNISSILSAADITDSEAIHPGYGFLAENSHFAEACITSGIILVGPTPGNIKICGDKAKTRQLMKKRGIAIIPGSDGIITSKELAIETAKEIGFPVLLKASAGGGGKGMRIVNNETELQKLFLITQREALAAFGNEEIYIEKYIPFVRHIEVQILSDNAGNIIHLGERECSIQRRHQKLLEEAPSVIATENFRKKIGELAIKIARFCKYKNAGTIEFLVDDKQDIYFMEINPRIQVEHPVTEELTGIDIIKEQIKIASGETLSIKQHNVKFDGHVIECRINAEDPEKFISSPGKITYLQLPGGPGIRIDSAAYTGWTIPHQYDSLIAKLIVKGKNRQHAIIKMKNALDEFKIEGIKTTIPFYKKILNNTDFISGNFNTNFIETL